MDSIEVVADTRHGVLLQVRSSSLVAAETSAREWAENNDYPVADVQQRLGSFTGGPESSTGGSPGAITGLYYYLQLIPNWTAQEARVVHINQVCKL